MQEQALGSLGEKEKLIRIDARVHEEVYSFLVDSGATHNFVNQEFVKKNGLFTEKGQQVKVKVANGDHVITNTFVRCYVDFGCVSGFLYFTVLPTCPLILGMSFLKQFKPVLNFDTM